VETRSPAWLLRAPPRCRETQYHISIDDRDLERQRHNDGSFRVIDEEFHTIFR
jgi:hypothetical protein